MLELKIESMKARGEISSEERDLLLARLKNSTSSETRKKSLTSPLRVFLAGMVCGIALAYLVWGLWGGPFPS